MRLGIWGQLTNPACSALYTASMGLHAPLTLSILRIIARRRGGRCLATHYSNNKTKLPWECSKRHRWMTRAMNVRTGHWCPECGGSRAKTLAELQATATARGGACLSTHPVAGHKYAEWRCAKGHEWRARPMNIRQGDWCPRCAPTAPLGIEVMQAAARIHGGHCLSKRYRNSRHKLSWKCARGHRWRAMGEKICAGQWCPTCARLRQGRRKVGSVVSECWRNR